MRGLLSAVCVGGGGGCLQNSPFKQLLSSSGRKSSSKRRVIGPLRGNRCLPVGVVKPTGFWSNSNTFFISCLFLLNARPCNGSVTGSFHTQPCSRPTPLGSNQGEPSPRRNFCVSSCTFKVSQRPPPPAPPSPPRTPQTSHVWKQSPTSGAATATRKGLKHQPNKHAHTQFSREQDGNLLVLARRVRRPDPRGSRPGAGMQTAGAPRWRGARSGRGLAGNAGQRRAGVGGGPQLSKVVKAQVPPGLPP